MDTKQEYLVSFGDSRQYLTSSTDKIEKAVRELREALAPRFEGMDITRYTIPQVVDADKLSKPERKAYPRLNADAIAEIRGVLETGIRDQASLKELNSDAPWTETSPTAE